VAPIGSGEHEARQDALNRRIANVTQHCGGDSLDRLELEFEEGGTLVIEAERLQLSWKD
jgi:hypothetical protein